MPPAAGEDLIVQTDSEGIVTIFSPGAERMLGYCADEVVGRTSPLLWHDPDEVAARAVELGVASGMQALLAVPGREGAELREWTFIRRDGSRLAVSLTVVAVRPAGGPIIGFVGVGRNVTLHRQAGLALQRLSHQQELILSSVGEGIYGMDLQGRATFVNAAAARATDYTAAELLGRDIHALVHHTRSDGKPYPHQDCPALATLRDGAVHEIADGLLWRRDGTSFPVEGISTPIHENGTLVGAVVIFRDISERKQAEKVREQLTAILEATTDYVGTADPQGRAVYLNRAGRAMLGLAEDENPQGTPVVHFHPAWAADLITSVGIPTAVREGAWSGETALAGRDGREIPTSQVILAHRSPAGSLEFLSTIIRDISERKQAEEQLEKREQQLADAQQMAHLGSWEWDLATGHVDWSDELCRIFGLKPEEFPGTYAAYLERVHPDDRDYAEQSLERARRAAAPFERVYRIVRPDGGVRVLMGHGKVVADESGWPVRIVGIALDVTEQQQAADALRASEHRMRLALEAGRMGIWEWDIPSDRVAWSEELERLSGLAPGTFAGTFEALLQLVPPEEREALRQGLERAVQERGEFDLEHRLVRPDGSTRWWAAKGRVFCDDAGQPQRMLGVAADITERRQAEEELRRTATELARSNAELQQFAYVASHDLQEPLRMVASYTQLLARRYQGQLDADADEFIGFAVDGARRMQNLILDLLAYSRVGTHGRPFAPTDCGALVDQVILDLSSAIEESGATVTRDKLPVVMADASQLAQVFQNLISNGIKFRGAEPPRVHLEATLRRAGDQPKAGPGASGEWEFSVRDNGIGIEPAYADRVFVIFQRLHTQAEYPGTGIGLAICKKIVERHAGRIWFESRPGQGTTFSFTLPADRLPPRPVSGQWPPLTRP